MKRLAAALLILGLRAGAEPVTLEHCLEAARESSPGLTALARQADAAREGIALARAAFAPQVKAGATWTQTDNPPQAFFMRLNQRTASLQEDFNQPEQTEQVRLSLGLQWAVWDFGQRRAGMRSALHEADAEAFLLESARIQLAHEITVAYYGILQAEALTAIHETSIRQLEEHRRVAQAREKAGSGLRSDVLTLEVRISEAREALLAAQQARQLGRVALNTAVGREVLTATGTLAAPPAIEVAHEGHLTEQPSNRAEWKAAKARLALRDEALQVARRARAPTLHAFGSLDQDSPDGSNPESSYLVGLSTEIPLIDGGRIGAAQRKAAAQRAAAEASLAQLESAIALEIEQARLALDTSVARIEMTRLAEDSASESLRLTEARYRSGAATLEELLTAQSGLTLSRGRAAIARFDQRIAQSNLERARGTRAGEPRT